MDVRRYERFSDVIRAVRKDRGMSQREMAKALHVSAGYVGQWELGLSKPSADVVRRICKTFDLNEVEYVLRLAFAESAPDFLRDSIVRYQPGEGPATDSQTPIEQRILAQAHRLGPQQQELLLSKLEGWVEAILKHGSN